jgi:hypothetical protein
VSIVYWECTFCCVVVVSLTLHLAFLCLAWRPLLFWREYPWYIMPH